MREKGLKMEPVIVDLLFFLHNKNAVHFKNARHFC